MNLICPHEKYFSQDIKKKFKKILACNFTNINQAKFNKLFYKYEVILARFKINIPYRAEHNIKFILSPTTGLNHINAKYLKDSRVNVISLKNESKILSKVNATVEHTVFLVLLALRKFLKNKKDKNIIIGNEINKKKIGLLGLGRIGKKVGSIFDMFGAEVSFYDKKIKKNLKNFRRKKLKNLLEDSDIISLHIPYEKKNENFINQKKLKLMKDNVILVNTSRGEVINEGDLISHIKRKRKFQYIADVISNENKKENNRRNFLSLKNNVILTPHIGGLTEESIKITDNFIYKKFLKYYLGN
jgi:D-3-phosphoglycerate dehydrogenase